MPCWMYCIGTHLNCSPLYWWWWRHQLNYVSSCLRGWFDQPSSLPNKNKLGFNRAFYRTGESLQIASTTLSWDYTNPLFLGVINFPGKAKFSLKKKKKITCWREWGSSCGYMPTMWCTLTIILNCKEVYCCPLRGEVKPTKLILHGTWAGFSLPEVKLALEPIAPPGPRPIQ